MIARRLPNLQLATISQEKITAYLLASEHPAGRAKSAFFQAFRFSPARWQALRDALIDHARSAALISIADTSFGRKYILEGPLSAPDGRAPRIRAIWFIDAGNMAPRFVTAYPLPGPE